MLLVTFMWKIHSYNFCGAGRKSNVTSSVTNYCCQKVIQVHLNELECREKVHFFL